jgi:Zn-dependent M28 family amino/carboxypeptidase
MFIVLDATAKAIFAAAGKNASTLQTQIDTTLKPAAMVLPGVRLEMRVVNTDRRQGTSANVAGMIEGSDPRLKDETIIYSGHLDHDGVRDNLIYPGADDDASGTVAVVELAHAFRANKVRPKRTLLFIVFTAEERGLLGSYYYVEHPLRPLSGTRAMINFDMIGRNETPSTQTENLRKIAPDTSNQLSLIGTIHSPEYWAVVEKQNRSIGLQLDATWDEDAALNVYQRSDQFPFAVHDIPAIWWFTGFHPDYHQPTDTIEKMNLSKMERVVKLAYLTGWAWASGAAQPPAFKANVKP